MADKQGHDIRRVDRYVDSNGREVLEFVQVFGKSKEENLVKGAMTLKIMVQTPFGPQPQMQRHEWPFPDGTSVKKAFEIWDDAANAELEEIKKHNAEKTKEKSIVSARSMPPLLGPDGKKLG